MNRPPEGLSRRAFPLPTWGTSRRLELGTSLAVLPKCGRGDAFARPTPLEDRGGGRRWIPFE